MELEHLAVQLFRICLSAYAVGAAASFALTRFPKIGQSDWLFRSVRWRDWLDAWRHLLA